ncbi:unnamed protein product [Rotaria sp. Silwood2]|nr:unnamed protein product [Rotaria sp. Silwood2]
MPAPLKPSFIETIHHDIYETINPRTTLANKARGKTILITGAGRGIGRAAAIAFAHAGADRLILTARTASQLDATANEVKAVSNEVEIMKIQTDMTNESQVDTLFRAIQVLCQRHCIGRTTIDKYRKYIQKGLYISNIDSIGFS